MFRGYLLYSIVNKEVMYSLDPELNPGDGPVWIVEAQSYLQAFRAEDVRQLSTTIPPRSANHKNCSLYPSKADGGSARSLCKL